MTIIHEDDDILVVDKPAGVIAHPAPGHEHDKSLTAFFIRHCPRSRTVGSVERPGIVHRLDQWTSGVMVLAKSQRAYIDLRHQFERHDTVRKTYLAVCRGTPKPACGMIDRVVAGRRAISHYRVLGAHDGRSLVEFVIDTGRMHQIRIHAASIGHPVIGDSVYGTGRRDDNRHLLHAVEISFLHPATHKRVTFSAPPPNDIVYS